MLCSTYFANSHELHKVLSLKLVLKDFAKNFLNHLPVARDSTIPCLNIHMERYQDEIDYRSNKQKFLKSENQKPLIAKCKRNYVENFVKMEGNLKACTAGSMLIVF